MDTTNLSTIIQTIPGVGPFIPYFTLACTLSAIACIFMPAPKTTTGAYYTIYQVVSTLAGNMMHAKNLSAPESKGIVGGPGAISDPMIATGVRPKDNGT